MSRDVGVGVVEHARLELALAEFAQMLLGEFAVADVLERLCQHATAVMPVLGVGVSLVETDGVHVAWSSGSLAGELEGLQRLLAEGPCLDAVATGMLVQAVLPDGERWPGYGPAAARLGVGSLLALPLLARGEAWGALDVYRTEQSGFDDDELRAARVLVDTAAAYVVTARDRQVARLAEEQLRQQTLHDPLTGLPNRLLMLDRLQQALASVERLPGSVGLLFLDLDRFKHINDAYGHIVGDWVLAQVARRFRDALRPADTLARLGGDEFVVLCEDLHLVDGDLDGIGSRLLGALSVPLQMPAAPEGEVTVRASIGSVRLAPGDTAEDVLGYADRAMYAAKQVGGGLVQSDRRDSGGAPTGLRMDAELQQVLQRGQLRLAYQPVIGLQSGAAQGVEALLRWQHPERGLLDASWFLPAVERTGLIGPIGSWVLREVARHLPALVPPDAPPGWFVGVNVAVQQLLRPGFAAECASVIGEFGVDPSHLLVEVTETGLVAGDMELVIAVRRLVDLGLRVALDDFGTGYSSMVHLKHFPASVLKIDKSFVDGLGRDPRDEALIRGTIALAHGLGMQVIAEGIEQPKQHDLLVSTGCDAAQGYLYGRPSLLSAA